MSKFCLIFLAVLGACCLHRIDLDVFDRSALDKKIVLYEEAVGEKCLYSEKGALIRSMAEHGVAAVDAMAEILESPRSVFPAEDAIDVIESVHWNGVDLRRHRAIQALARIAESASDPALRKRAKAVSDELER